MIKINPPGDHNRKQMYLYPLVPSFIERRTRLIVICSSTHIEVLFSVRVEDHLIFHFTTPSVPASAADFTRNV